MTSHPGERPGLIVHITHGHPVLLTLTGEIDLGTAADLARPLRALITRTDPAPIDIDLTAVPFMDSTGIQVLVAAQTDAHAAGVSLRITALSPQVRRVLTLTGVLHTLGIPTDDAAPTTTP